MTLPATAKDPETLEDRFNRLADEWERDTAHFSSIRRRARHPAFQEIVAMGTGAIPLLLRALMARSAHYSAVLHAITGASPTPREDWGKMDRVAQAWLRWGHENGYSW